MESSEAKQDKPFRIVAAVDFSPASKAVLLRALALANREPGAEVHAVAVADYDRTLLGLHGVTDGQTPSDAVMKLQEFAKGAVDELSASLGGQLRLQRVVTHLLTGSPAQEIVWLAAHIDADLVVVGTHGRKGLPRLLLGSVAERVVRTAGCPVYIVRDKHHESAWRVPEIEPPCPDCLAARSESGGEKLWCERHQSHVHTHVYSGAETASSRAVRPWGFDA